MEQQRLDDIEAHLSEYADRRLVAELLEEITNLRRRLGRVEYSSLIVKARALEEAATSLEAPVWPVPAGWSVAAWLRTRARRMLLHGSVSVEGDDAAIANGRGAHT